VVGQVIDCNADGSQVEKHGDAVSLIRGRVNEAFRIDVLDERAKAMKLPLVIAILLGIGCSETPSIMAKYRVQRVSPAGTIHGEWIVESDSFPLVDADSSGATFVKTRRRGTWTYSGVFAPPSWLLNVTVEAVRAVE
jgi:hypothetical protein